MMLTLGFVSFLLSAGPAASAPAPEDRVATLGSIYVVEACRGRCAAEDRSTLYRGHVVLLNGAPDVEGLRFSDGWRAARFPEGSNGCLAVSRYRDEASGEVLAEPASFNTAVEWSRGENGSLVLAFTTDAGERRIATLQRRGGAWIGQIRSEAAERGVDPIALWQVGRGASEHCVALAK